MYLEAAAVVAAVGNTGERLFWGGGDRDVGRKVDGQIDRQTGRGGRTDGSVIPLSRLIEDAFRKKTTKAMGLRDDRSTATKLQH